MSPLASDFGADYTLTKNITLTYTEGGVTGTTSYDITIVNDVQNIKAYAQPTKTTYNVNETMDMTGAEILVTRATGLSTTVKVTDGISAGTLTLTGFDSSKEQASEALTATYTENGISKTATFTIAVKDSVESVAIKGTPTTTYKYGDPLVYPTITAQKGSGPVDITTDSSMVSGYNPNKLGTQTVTITYGGQSTTYDVTVNDYVADITLVAPTKTTYNYGESLDLTGGTVQKVMASGATETAEALDSTMVSGYNASTVGAQTITVTYAGKTKTFNVTVNDTVKAITITKPTSTQKYNYGGSLDYTGGKITVSYNGGTADKTVALSSATATETVGGASLNMSPLASDFGADYTLTKNITLTYTEGGVTGTTSYDISIVNDVQNIKAYAQPTKTTYNVNETMDMTGAEILVTRATGLATTVKVTDGISAGTLTLTGFDSSKEQASEALTATYTENGISKTATFTIAVKDSVESIAIKGTPTTTYKYGDPLVYPTITAQKGSGPVDITTDSSMVSGYNPNKLGTQTVTITYGGQSTTYDVTVSDYVSDITLVAPTKTTYNYGESLDLTGGTVQKVMASGATETAEALDSTMVSGYNASTVGAQTITVTYAGKTKTFNVTVNDTVKAITITKPTSTQKYNYGGSLDYTGGKITVSYNGGTADKTVALSSATATETVGGASLNMSPLASDFGADYTLTKNITLTYTEGGVTGTTSYDITIVNDVQNIKAYAQPTKTTYNVNETMDMTGAEILVTRATGLSTTVKVTDGISAGTLTLTGFDSSKEQASEALTATYTENGISKTATFTIAVKDSVESVAIKGTPTTTYKYGDPLVYPTITAQKGSGPVDITTDSSMVSGYNPNKLGTQTVTITYGGQSTTYDVTVSDYVADITLVAPTKITYNYGESLDFTGGTVQKVMASGATETAEALDSTMVSGYNASTVGTQPITVTYAGKTKTFNVTVSDKVLSTTLEGTPKTSYNYGEKLDLSGLTIKVTKTSGSTTISMTDSKVTVEGFDSSKVGTQTVTVKYDGNVVGTPITVEVKDFVKGIVLTAPTKASYEYGEALDLTGGKVQEVMASGSATTPVALNDSSVTLGTYDPTKTGIQTINVTYKGFTDKFAITVVDSINSIAIKQMPKQNYKYGEKLDLTNATIEISHTSGTKEIKAIDNSMVTGYNPNKLGTQTLTVDYNGIKTQYDVNVVDFVKDIEITSPTKLIYNLNEKLDLTGGTVKEIMASGSATTPISMTSSTVKVTGFDSTKEGANVITVTYEGFTKTFGTTVVDPTSDIKLKTLPTKLNYLYGEKLDITGATLEVTKLSGAKNIVNVTPDMVTGYNPNKLGNQTITVTYLGTVQEFNIKVDDYTKELQITKPEQTEYEYGQKLDLTNAKVSIIMASGKIAETTDMTASMLSTYNPNLEGTQTINVTYKGLSNKFDVTVTDKIKAISINTQPNKTNYAYGESLDLTGATLQVVKSSGIKIINVTPDMVTGYDPNHSGTQLLTITYKGFTTAIIVNVGEKPTTNSSTNNTNNTTKNNTSKNTVIPAKTTDNNAEETSITPIENTTTNTQESSKTDTTNNINSNKNNSSTQTTESSVKKQNTSLATYASQGLKNQKVVAGLIGFLALIFLLLLVFKRNVKIYVEEDGEIVLGGKDRLSTVKKLLNVDKYLDGETAKYPVKVELNKNISRALDEDEITIKYKGESVNRTIKYENDKFVIYLR